MFESVVLSHLGEPDGRGRGVGVCGLPSHAAFRTAAAAEQHNGFDAHILLQIFDRGLEILRHLPFPVHRPLVVDGVGVEAENDDAERRLPQLTNISFGFVEGESLLMGIKDIACSSGSACTSASLEPSYVLRALGVDTELAHSSIRFGLGRFNTEEEVDYVAQIVIREVKRLREMSPLYELHNEGVDYRTIQWVAH